MMDYLMAVALLCANHNIDRERCQVNVIKCTELHKDKMQPFPTPMIVEKCYLDSRDSSELVPNIAPAPLSVPKK